MTARRRRVAQRTTKGREYIQHMIWAGQGTSNCDRYETRERHSRHILAESIIRGDHEKMIYDT